MSYHNFLPRHSVTFLCCTTKLNLTVSVYCPYCLTFKGGVAESGKIGWGWEWGWVICFQQCCDLTNIALIYFKFHRNLYFQLLSDGRVPVRLPTPQFQKLYTVVHLSALETTLHQFTVEITKLFAQFVLLSHHYDRNNAISPLYMRTWMLR
jgi:hypothetical protein